jgi:hypothetical protein
LRRARQRCRGRSSGDAAPARAVRRERAGGDDDRDVLVVSADMLRQLSFATTRRAPMRLWRRLRHGRYRRWTTPPAMTGLGRGGDAERGRRSDHPGDRLCRAGEANQMSWQRCRVC